MLLPQRYAWVAAVLVFLFVQPFSKADDLLDDFDKAFAPANENVVAEVEAQPPQSEPAAPVDEADQSAPTAKQPAASDEPAFELTIQTPIDAQESTRVRAALDQLQANYPNATVVVRFKSEDATAESLGSGTQYEAALAIARVLIGPVGGKLRSVAYVDRPLKGHAVLVAIACERIAVTPEAEIGSAAVDEANYDETIVLNYQQIARQRGRFPAAFVDSLLDANAQLYQVQLVEGDTQFVNQATLDQLAQDNRVLRQDRLTVPGQLGYFSGALLREKNWIDFAPNTLDDLLEQAKIVKLEAASKHTGLGDAKPVLFDIDGEITPVVVNRAVRVLREASSTQAMNLCIVELSSSGGTLEDCNRLASFLLGLSSKQVQTVALVDGTCQGGAALVAMACDRCIVIEGSRFGGDGVKPYETQDIYELVGLWENLSEESNKPESQFYSVISSKLPLFEYRSNTGQITLGTPQLMERPEMINQWHRIPNFQRIDQVNLEEARQRGWITEVVANKAEAAAAIGIDQLPAAVEMSKFEEWIAQLANNNALKTVLVIAGLLTFTTELTAPGSIFFGFISLCCFSLYFWLQFLNGTVESLEIVLFIVGILSICLEVFVVPGFGVFGIGGIVLCLLGLILSAQRFVIPVTSIQWSQFAWNLFTVAASGLAAIVLLIALSGKVANSPFFRWMELAPAVEPQQQTKIVVENLTGMSGLTITACNPYGRARINGKTRDVRVEDGYVDNGKDVIVVRMESETAVVRPV